ncbi:MAG: hypothetical protein HPY53_16345 [Brevinematales bacterium]|nr:hypothetical protein [Brevinematales bacterium]
MKRIIVLFFIVSIPFLGCSSGPEGGLSGLNNPLRLYDSGFPILNVFKAGFRYPGHNKPCYSNQGYTDINGYLSNTNYIQIIGLSNLAHIYYNGSIWQTNIFTNISLSNNYYSGEYFVNANGKYFATVTTQYDLKVYLISNLQLVFQETNVPVYKQQALLGNGNSDIIAYVYIDTNIRVVNLSNTNVINIGNGFYVCAFSLKNKYLIYTDFEKKDKYYFWNDYVYDDRKYNGQPFIYDIQNNTNYSIATYQCLNTGVGFNNGDYGTTIAMGLHDGFYAIDYSLTNLYIYICDPDYSFVYDKNLYDGTYAPDAEGLYRIDISSLGLSE